MIEVRAERTADRTRTREIQRAAFGRDEEADLLDALRSEARPQISLIAELDGRAVGHVFISPAEIETAPPGTRAGALAPIGVDPELQGRGVGSALVRAGLDACPALGWRAVFLVGNPAYYGRFGFVLAGPRGFCYGHPALDAALQVMELGEGLPPGCSGQVRYPPAFGQGDG